MKDLEIERRFPLLDYSKALNMLMTFAEKVEVGVYQKDTYFNPPHMDFLAFKPISEWLRIRDNGK